MWWVVVFWLWIIFSWRFVELAPLCYCYIRRRDHQQGAIVTYADVIVESVQSCTFSNFGSDMRSCMQLKQISVRAGTLMSVFLDDGNNIYYLWRLISWNAWNACKDIRIRSFYHSQSHTHAHTLQIHALLVMGWYNQEKKKKREEMGFQLMLDKFTHETLNSERKHYSTAHAYITATIQ